ncbi:zinc ribbon domain-containing protein [Corynebacterium sp.]|uniref:zinc ribbon domain-containing protein n=1 Tax=Corynebacterium sp. TaxID=1720 RepID=UPI002646FF83|nr:C4-type zinc ribbon domain-containing protein [Corynebacterium sp.]MDN6136521.1 C4-type zinc ribbon domain-containing protein [Corynebacterium sp.]MDN6737461.1 C4-type zinc ribbon domain-containing protein [Corynebacterium sp.]
MKLEPKKQQVLLELSRTMRLSSVGAQAPELAEKAELEKAEKEHKRALDAAAAAQMAVDDVENDILRIQSDERKLRKRERDDKAQLSAAPDPDVRRELEHDRYAAKSRIADLMSELQEAHNEIHALRNNRDVHGARVDEAARKVETARRAFDAAQEATPVEAERDIDSEIAQLRSQLDEDVLAEFERQRLENGVGVEEFKAEKTCGGCSMVLPPAERSAILNAPKNEMPQCSDCGSYLVRPA